MFKDILFILVNYLEYRDLIKLSKIMKIPDYIWTISFTKTFGLQNIELKEFYSFLYTNSFQMTEYKKIIISNVINNKDIVDSIVRLFSFYPLIFSTRNNTIYELCENDVLKEKSTTNNLKEISYSYLFDMFAHSRKNKRIVFDFQLDHWNIDEIKDFKINEIYKFMQREILFIFKVKEIILHNRKAEQVKLHVLDLNVSNMLISGEILSGKHIKISDNYINLLFYNNYFIYYQINTIRSITKTRLILVARRNFFDLLACITDKIKIQLFNNNLL